MSNNSPGLVIRMFPLLLAICACCAGALGQAPTPTPTPNPATLPPGQEQIPPPTAPPATQQNPPQAPPGTNLAPSPQPTPVQPGLTEPRQPGFQPQPLPPPPNLTRLGVASDNVLALSLNDAIRRALQNNNDIEVARDDVRFAEQQLRSLEGVYGPVFSVTPQITRNVQPQQSSLGGSGSSGTTETTVYTLSPSITKLFEKGGGTYSLTFANTHTNTTSLFSLINPFYSSNLSLTFTQPLMRNRSIDNSRRQIRIQSKRLEQSDADFRQRTIQIIAQMQAAYWNLVFALRNQQNQLDSVNLARENLRRIEIQIAAGAKAPLDRAQVQTELATREANLLVATQNVSVAENALKQLMLRDPSSSEWSAQLTPTDTPVFALAPVNLSAALEEARKNRPEIRHLNLQREINAVDIKYYKNQTMPQVDIQSTLATTGLAGTPLGAPAGTLVPLISGNPSASSSAFLLQQIQDIQARIGAPVATPPLIASSGAAPNLTGGYGKDLANVLSFKTYNTNVGVAISFPLHNKTAEANLAGARIQREQLEASFRSQEQAIEIDVRNAAQAVETAQQRVLKSRVARQSAELQLEGERRLYEVGRSTTFLLFQRENELSNARTQELQAETDYNKALADLQRATSATLRVNNVVVESPAKP